jgi:oligosaccharyltransferase complex subunit alpha (ribophorin I)
MKLLASLPAAFLSLLGTATAAATKVSEDALQSTFTPPEVFKNVNLVHIISLEKSYVKETVNVIIENIASTPQDEYYLPFTADQMSRIGGVEVKDRKDATLGPLSVEAAEFDPER